MSVGLYIHIPFCLRKCPYCDFYSEAHNPETVEAYVHAVIASFGSFPSRRVDTVYFGGGTPSLLSPSQIGRIIAAADSIFGIAGDAEITMECNPATADGTMLRGFHDAGVNRLSIGIQSLDDTVLRSAGRLHSAEEAVRTVKDAACAGFENVSVDLMIGLPGDTPGTFIKTLAGAAELAVKHISAYMLKLMPGTPFGENPPENIAGDDTLALMYEHCCEYLEDKGINQYEISNFALPGYESRHNLKYWRQEPYIGTGAAAHGCLDGVRYSFVPDLRAFIDLYKHETPDYRSVTRPEGVSDVTEFIMLRLRTAEGISFSELYSRYNFAFDKQRLDLMKACASEGMAEMGENVFRLTAKGFLVSNEIITRLI